MPNIHIMPFVSSFEYPHVHRATQGALIIPTRTAEQALWPSLAPGKEKEIWELKTKEKR